MDINLLQSGVLRMCLRSCASNTGLENTRLGVPEEDGTAMAITFGFWPNIWVPSVDLVLLERGKQHAA
jgi:hypothetical protein